jgi:hypothetical protein
MSNDNSNKNNGDDDLDDDAPGGPDYRWFEAPAPSVGVTFAVAGIVWIWIMFQHHQRLQRIKRKVDQADFRGSLRLSAYISAYVDNNDPTFAIARLVGKSTVFLGLMQMNFQSGFLIMLAVLAVESLLDTAGILMAYWSPYSMAQMRAASEEGQDEAAAKEVTRLEPANVYEDMARPMSIAIMVFLVQGLLIGCVMYDSYTTTTRTCFDGDANSVCPMLASSGSYGLYFLGTFMACVFYIGPLNSYGAKEQDPVFWLKLFVTVMSNQSRGAVLSWNDPGSDFQTQVRTFYRNDLRIWMRFFMSLIVNSAGFSFLLHVLPVQIASKSAIMGVVFSSVGMIYLVDLDDTTGKTLTLVAAGHQPRSAGYASLGTTGSTSNNGDLEAVKQRLLDEAIQEIQSKLQVALADGNIPSTRPSSDKNLENVTNVLYRSKRVGAKYHGTKRKQVGSSEETPLMTA